MGKLGMSQHIYEKFIHSDIKYSVRQRDRVLGDQMNFESLEDAAHRESHWYKITLDVSKIGGRRREKYLDGVINAVCDHADIIQDSLRKDDPGNSPRYRYEIGVTLKNDGGDREKKLDAFYKLAKRVDQLEGIAGDHMFDWGFEHGKMIGRTNGIELYSKIASGLIPSMVGGYLAYKGALHLANTYVTENNFPNGWAQEIVGIGGQAVAMVGGALLSMFAGYFGMKKLWNGKFNRDYRLRDRYHRYAKFREALIGNTVEFDPELETPTYKRMSPEDFRMEMNAILSLDQIHNDGF